MKRSATMFLYGFLTVSLIAACGSDDDGDGSGAANVGQGGSTGGQGAAGEGGDGGDGTPEVPCQQHGDCAPEPCGFDEAAVATCVDGFCATTCESGYAPCAECTDFDQCPHQDCAFLSGQVCSSGKCLDYCSMPLGSSCIELEGCPRIRCPGTSAILSGCAGPEGAKQCATTASVCCTE